MKITTAKIVIFQEGNERPLWYTDPWRAAEHWARVKADEWVEKNKDRPEFKTVYYGQSRPTNQPYDLGRVRYRKLKRRALPIFRKIMDINS